MHRASPHDWRCGNPKLSSIVDNTAKRFQQNGADYIPTGDSPLSPWELLDIRTHLLSTNHLADLQLFTMVLLCCNLFLRGDEVVSIRFDHFVRDLAIVGDVGFVEALTLKVKGKCDPRPVTLMIWSDEVIPQLCPVRHLLVYVHLACGTNDEYLFSGDKNGHFSSGAFQDRFKGICNKILDRDGPFGTHSCRKTAYLLAVWGGGEE